METLANSFIYCTAKSVLAKHRNISTDLKESSIHIESFKELSNIADIESKFCTQEIATN